MASFGAFLLEKDVLTLSLAPRDSYKAQVQFALERGLPAFVGMLGTQRLPLPSSAFDLVHCSRCLVPWGAYSTFYSFLFLLSRMISGHEHKNMNMETSCGFLQMALTSLRWTGCCDLVGTLYYQDLLLIFLAKRRSMKLFGNL